MSLFVRIVDGAVEPGSIGPLPESSTRLDTLEPVHDLGGAGAKWQRAAGWYDVATLDLGTLGLTPEQREAIADELDAATTRHDKRTDLDDKVHNATSLARDKNWDWIDAYCHGEVAQVPFVQAQSPNAGALWGGLTTFEKAEALRLGVSWALAELIRVSQALDLVFDALEQPIVTSDVDTSPDR